MKTVKLRDVCDVFADGDWIESKDQSISGIRLVQTGNIGVGVFKDRVEKARYISEATFRRLNCIEVLPGDLLVSRLPDPVGRSCIIPDIGERMITAVDCTIIRVKSVLPRYLLYFMQSTSYQVAVESMCSGATRKRISRNNLGSIGIPLAPIEEQRRIVERLDAAFEKIDRAIELTEKNIHSVKRLYTSKFNEIFDNLSDKPTICIKDWTKTGAGGTPNKSHTEYYNGGTISWLRSGEVNKKEIISSELSITQAGLDNSSAKVFPINSVLVAMYGATAGQVGILRFMSATNQAVCAIYPDQDIDSEYMYYSLMNQKKNLLAQAVGNAQPNVSQIKIKNLEIHKIDIDEQKAISREISELDYTTQAVADAYRKKLQTLGSLRQSLLTQAFSIDGVE